MSEEPKPNEPTATNDDPGGAGGITQAQLDAAVRDAVKSKERDLVKQIKTLKGELDTVNHAATERQKQEQLESENFKGLFETAEAERARIESESVQTISSLKSELVETKLFHALASNGVTDEVQQLGFLSKYNRLEGERPAPRDWVELLKQEDPDRFKVKASVNTTAGAAGSVSQSAGSGETIEDRLKSPDPKVRQAANLERLKSRLGGLS
jgi:hypothetical protein